jgi:aspartyl-tRNA(Asn)/glutamyl-tRNA(Gln) amidotransferase subunit C
MPVDIETVRRIAALARLDLTLGLGEGEAAPALRRLSEEFGDIVGYMDILSELDTEGVEPLYSPMLEPEGPREDEPRKDPPGGGRAESIVSQGPQVLGRLFVVPRVV